MKKRLHDKKAGVAILIALIVIALADVIFRAVAIGEAIYTARNLGEQLVVIALAATILILNAKGKDRACYICYGAWIGYFILNQLFELPSMIATLIQAITSQGYGIDALVSTIVASLGFVSIGMLLVEYIIDGTIYNRAFNVIGMVTVLSIFAASILNIIGIADGDPASIMLVVFYNLHRLAMVFLCTFFAYDSAKFELQKAKLAK